MEYNHDHPIFLTIDGGTGGIRVGLYGYTTTDTPATACFDYFKYDVKR